MVEPPEDSADGPDEPPLEPRPRRPSPFPSRDSPWPSETRSNPRTAAAPTARLAGSTVTAAGVAVGCLAALVGGIAGVVIALAVTSALLSGQGQNALIWAVTFIFFCLFAIPLGAGAALGLWGYLRDRKTKRS